ncbi:conserved hypothetical protein [Bosea sp. 62]|uniref:hypothetical protein n=1 Tax=unclassified Bosea (in: a-proteobacteria) TaxID=2653178 RepID=UPI0012589E2D|nr:MULTISPECIES: hypothetical protein [unclassified Bosea (in: a-proteobacteria)]CAD5255641.1 conserved hypothetical protein [Bosea sp. 7B]CAD5275143.1 conserved hypothetical protein [Bosea sp. 21B]CAD5276266.1 conserved hypothetical protein [Bosea sp. 46]VVT60025.1 conserved hypothetical protein [Bosea sp. EC-HK365B]VXB52106.1 conserved hypothetical protein [Bosea sp. 62]
MKRWQPILYPGPGGIHVNFDQGTGARGSRPDADGYQNILDELSNVVEKSGVALSTGSLDVAKGIRSGRLNYIAVGGTANALTGALDPAIASYDDLAIGTPLRLKILLANTGPAAIALNGLAPIAIVRQDGAALRKGDLQPGIREAFFDGVNLRLFSLVLQTERTVTLTGRVTAQYLPNGVETAVEWAPPAAGTDPLGWYNPAQPTRLTCPVGIERAVFSFAIGFENSSVGYRKGRVVHNGVNEGSGLPVDVVLPTAADIGIPNGTGSPYPLAAGDYVQVLGYTNPGGPHLLRRANTSFSVSY